MQIFFYAIILLGAIGSASEDPEMNVNDAIFTSLLAVGICLVVFVLIQWLLLSLSYKHTYYAYTNKRIIIRKGIIGVDFKSLDIKMIGASDVHVSIFDKLLKKNTGTLCFGSTASPLMNNGTNVNSFTFANIEKPYDLYKEIKSYISDNSETKKKETKKTTKK